MKKETKKKLIAGVVILTIIGIFLPDTKPKEATKEVKKEKSDKKDLSNEAYTFCKMLVEKELEPYTADFPFGERTIKDNGLNEYVIKSSVITQNKYGAKIKKRYKCNIAYKGSGDILDGSNWSYSIDFN